MDWPLCRSMLSFEDFVEHYAQMASKDGWIDYARHRVMEMERDPMGLFKGLGPAVAKRLKEIRDEANRGN